MKIALAILLCLSANFASARSLQDTGYLPPRPYFRVHNSGEMCNLAAQYLPPNPVVVEAGAYDGSESAQMAQIWKEGQIHSFEPIASLYENVVRNTAGIANISTYKLALGQEQGEKTIYLALTPEDLSKICMSSSFYPPKDHTLYYGPIFQGTEVVQMTTLDEWAKAYNIEKIDLLWLDLQGYELAAFKGGAEILSTVSVIMTEVSFSELYEGQPLYREVRAWLENQGFVLIAGDFSFPKDPNQHFGDALFVRID